MTMFEQMMIISYSFVLKLFFGIISGVSARFSWIFEESDRAGSPDSEFVYEKSRSPPSDR